MSIICIKVLKYASDQPPPQNIKMEYITGAAKAGLNVEAGITRAGPGRRFNGDLVVNETPPTFGSFDLTHPRRLRLSLRAPPTLGNVIRALFNDVTLVESDANCSMRS